MGKRKYEDTTIDDSKTSKSDETATVEDSQQIDNESEVNKKLSKVGGFNVKHFRKELSTKQGQTIGEFKIYNIVLPRLCAWNFSSTAHGIPLTQLFKLFLITLKIWLLLRSRKM